MSTIEKMEELKERAIIFFQSWGVIVRKYEDQVFQGQTTCAEAKTAIDKEYSELRQTFNKAAVQVYPHMLENNMFPGEMKPEDGMTCKDLGELIGRNINQFHGVIVDHFGNQESAATDMLPDIFHEMKADMQAIIDTEKERVEN